MSSIVSQNAEVARRRAAGLSCWSAPVEPEPLGGGLSNANFLVRHRGERFVVRVCGDVPEHRIVRENDVAASRAAFAAGIAPEVVHAEPGATVLRHVDGRTLGPQDVRAPDMIERIADLVARVHVDVGRHLGGRRLRFNAFEALRAYEVILLNKGARILPQLPRLLAIAGQLEAIIGPDEGAFCHNDLLAANLIDDGARLWLIDWEYGGFNSALFDLGNFLSNNEVPGDAGSAFLARYLGRPPEADFDRRLRAMTSASLLREAVWALVAELHSPLAVDYAGYADTYLGRFERSLAEVDLG